MIEQVEHEKGFEVSNSPDARFKVTRMVGYSTETHSPRVKPGYSYMVVDSAWNYRLMGLFRSEESFGGQTRAERILQARARALALAARLEAETGVLV